MTKIKTQGLVSDLMPNIKLMQLSGHFLFNYHSGKTFNDFFYQFSHIVVRVELDS